MCTLTIRFKLFDFIAQKFDLKNDTSLISSDEEEEEGSDSEDEDD